MPTLGNMRIPPPNGWEEFESIVTSSLELRWRTSDLTKHGRQGQAQDGVDLYGHDDLGRFVGIQCKLTVNSINESIINREILSAEKFTPSISTLYIATTSPSDVGLQQFVRTLSQTRASSGKFSVGILFWADIVQDLSKDINAIQRHYPQLFLTQSSNPSSNLDLRQRDIEKLRELLEYIDIESIPYEIEMAPKSVLGNFLCESDIFQPIITNPSFHIYDEQLSLKLHSWLNKWYEIICAGRFTYEYHPHADRLIFPMPMDLCRTPEESKLFEHLVNLYSEFDIKFRDFTSFIHQKYPEIDMKATSVKARKWKAQFN